MTLSNSLLPHATLSRSHTPEYTLSSICGISQSTFRYLFKLNNYVESANIIRRGQATDKLPSTISDDCSEMYSYILSGNSFKVVLAILGVAHPLAQ